MKNLLYLIFICLIIPIKSWALPSFPGAEGFGSDTIGGRGGTLIEVTNLNNAGAGSFREACESDNNGNPRIIIFRTGGTITLDSVIQITDDNVTIAGQSAPGDGITLRKAGIRIKSSDVIVRGLRIRIGDDLGGENPDNRDGLQIENDTKQIGNIIVDHCSISWAIDETLTLWHEDLHDVTISNTIIGEALYNSLHSDSPHSKGSLSGSQGITDISYIKNLFIHNDERNPKIRATSVALINNVHYNHRWKVVDIEFSNAAQSISIVGNVFLEGNDTLFTNRPIYIRSNLIAGTLIYLDDNGDEGDYGGAPFYEIEDDFEPITGVLQTWPLGVVAEDSGDVVDLVMANVGAYHNNRDSVDTRLISDLLNRTGDMIDSPSDVGGWPVLDAGTYPTDTDGDGMPDTWETDRGLNPNLASDGNDDRNSDGWTNIEEYLNELIDGEAEDTTAPEFSSATIDGTIVVINWSESCTRGTGYDDSDFDLDMSVTGNNIGVTYVSGDGTNQWIMTSASAAVNGETVDLDFNGDTDSIEDDAGNDLEALISETVTNNTSIPGFTLNISSGINFSSGTSYITN